MNLSNNKTNEINLDLSSTTQYQINSDDDLLSFSKNFSIQRKNPSLKEMQVRDEEELKHKLLKLNISYNINSNQSQSTFDSSPCDLNSHSNRYLNIENDEVSNSSPLISMKFILIGDKHVGKSLFKRRIMEIDQIESSISQGLDIKKRVVVFCNKSINLEIWDVNTQFHSSPIVMSK